MTPADLMASIIIDKVVYSIRRADPAVTDGIVTRQTESNSRASRTEISSFSSICARAKPA